MFTEDKNESYTTGEWWVRKIHFTQGKSCLKQVNTAFTWTPRTMGRVPLSRISSTFTIMAKSEVVMWYLCIKWSIRVGIIKWNRPWCHLQVRKAWARHYSSWKMKLCPFIDTWGGKLLKHIKRTTHHENWVTHLISQSQRRKTRCMKRVCDLVTSVFTFNGFPCHTEFRTHTHTDIAIIPCTYAGFLSNRRLL